MLQMLRKRLNKDEEGFTLIELMVVVLIIAILLAIAIPTFLGARTRAQHRSTESNLRNALTAEKTAYTDAQAYVDSASTTPALSSIEPSLTYQATAPAAGTNQVQVFATGNNVCMAAKSADGTTFWVGDNGSGTFYGSVSGSTDTPASFSTQASSDATCTSAIITSMGTTTTLGGW